MHMSLIEKVEDTTNSPLFTLATLSFLVGGGYAKYFKGAPTWNPYVITGCTMLTIALIADWNFDRKWKGTSLQEWEAHYRDDELLWQDDFETIVPLPEGDGVYAATRINEPDVTYFVRQQSVGGDSLFRILWIEEPDESIVVSEMAADWGGMNLTGGVDEIDEMLGKKKRAENQDMICCFEPMEFFEDGNYFYCPVCEDTIETTEFEAPYAFKDDRCDNCERSAITDQDMKRIPIFRNDDDGHTNEYDVCEPCYETLIEETDYYASEEEKPTKTTSWPAGKEGMGHRRWLVGEGYSGRAKCKVCGEIIPKGQPTIDFHSTRGIQSIHSRPEHCAVKRAESFAVEAYDESITVWICGACNRRFEDQNDAEACCEGLEEDEIPYFDGRSKELREVHIHEAEQGRIGEPFRFTGTGYYGEAYQRFTEWPSFDQLVFEPSRTGRGFGGKHAFFIADGHPFVFTIGSRETSNEWRGEDGLWLGWPGPGDYEGLPIWCPSMTVEQAKATGSQWRRGCGSVVNDDTDNDAVDYLMGGHCPRVRQFAPGASGADILRWRDWARKTYQEYEDSLRMNAETMGPPETVSKKGSVKTMSGKPHTPRKLTKDQDITPEEARKRVRLEAEQNPAAGAFHPSETVGEQIVRPDGPMTVDQAKGFMDNLRRYRKTMSAEGENEEIESVMDLVMEISVSEDLFDDLEYYYPEEWYNIFLSSYDDPDEEGYQLVVIHEDDFDDFYEMRESLRYLPPSPTTEYKEDMDLEEFWDEEARE